MTDKPVTQLCHVGVVQVCYVPFYMVMTGKPVTQLCHVGVWFRCVMSRFTW